MTTIKTIAADQIIACIEDAEAVSGLDVREEIIACLKSGSETGVELHDDPEIGDDGYQTGNRTHFAYFPNAGRGAVWTNGNASWTDATSLADLADRHANPERWSN